MTTLSIRFPSFSSDWSKKEIKEIATTYSGGTPKSGVKGFFGGEIPFIKSGEIDSLFTTEKITIEGYESSSAKYIDKGDLLLALYGATSGEVGIAKLHGAINQAVLCIRTKENKEFLYYWFQKSKEFILRTYLQGGQGNLSAGIIKNLDISLPSINEQERIASFLSSIDQRISLLKKKKELLERYKKGVMQQLFPQAGSKNPQVRFKQEDGSDFPDWEEVRLGEVFKEEREQVGKREIEEFSISAGIGFVSQSIKFGRVISGEQKSKYLRLRNGFFAYNKGNSKTYNYGCIYLNEFDRDISIPNVFIAFSPTPIVDSGFYKQYFIGHGLDRQLRRIISSTARMDGLLNVSRQDFFNLKIPKASIEEQEKIGAFLNLLDQRISVLTSIIESADNFKKGLLQQMFV